MSNDTVFENALKEIMKTHTKKDIDNMITKIIEDNKKSAEIQIDKTTDKYKILLVLFNKILISIGEKEISDLREFKKIDKKVLISDNSKKILNEMMPEIFKYFNKKKCGWYSRNHLAHYELTLMRHMISNVGLQFKSKKRTRHEHALSVFDMLYSIL